LLFRRNLAFEFLGSFLTSPFRWVFCWVWFRRWGFSVLSKRFFHRDALIDRFPFSFFEFDGLVMREMFYVFRVVIRRRVLRFRCTMVLL
jgi:hypothetical protein